MNRTMRAAYQFFRENAGGIVGHNAETAIALARAEHEAWERDWEASWEWDDDADLGDHEEWCCTAQLNARGRNADGSERPSYFREPQCEHEAYVAVLKDEDGNVLKALGGIIDPDSKYMRVIEAELALEALSAGHSGSTVSQPESQSDHHPSEPYAISVNVPSGIDPDEARALIEYALAKAVR